MLSNSDNAEHHGCLYDLVLFQIAFEFCFKQGKFQTGLRVPRFHRNWCDDS